MEEGHLVETSEKLPKLGKSLADQRALSVRKRDPDDYPAAALAALLSRRTSC